MNKLTEHVKGDLVFDALADAAGSGRDIHELMDSTSLTRSQVRGGLDYVRRVLAEFHDEPIVCLRQPDGRDAYFLAANEDEVVAYAMYRLRVHAKQARNLLTAALTPALTKFNRPLTTRLINKHLARAVEDLDELIALDAEDEPAGTSA